MPSTKVKPCQSYPPHWINCLKFLAGADPSQESSVTLEEHLSKAQAHTKHAIARTMRQSVKQFRGWNPEVVELLSGPDLAFSKREGHFGWSLVAIRRRHQPSITEILENGKRDGI